MSKKEDLRTSHQNNLKEYINTLRESIRETLEKENISAGALSGILKLSDTVIGNFLDGQTEKLNSAAIVAYADYIKAPTIDEVLGREIKGIANKVEIVRKPKPPDFIAGLSPETQQSIMSIREKTGKFIHEPTKTKKTKPSRSDERSR